MRVCSSIGHSYGVQLATIYEQALTVYTAYSDWVSGQSVTAHPNRQTALMYTFPGDCVCVLSVAVLYRG